MADIFLSYASADRPRAKQIAQALEQRGWDVWWDREIPLGRPYNEIIPEELSKARCVLVLWSPQSAQSSWVYEEAVKGRDRKVLIPALIEATEIPMGFGLLQAADLTQWPDAHASFDPVIDSIKAVLEGGSAPGPQRVLGTGTAATPGVARWIWIVASALVLGLAALWYAQRPSTPPAPAQQPVAAGKLTGATLVHTLAGHNQGVNKIAFSPDGVTLASAGADGRLIVWSIARHNPIATLTQHNDVLLSVAFAPNGKWFASGGWGGEVMVWDAATREPLMAPIAAHAVSVDDIAFSPNSALFATGSSRDGGKVKVWEAAGGKLRLELDGGRGATYCVAFSPDGKTLASGSGKYVALWDVASGTARLEPFEADSAVVNDIAFSADGKRLASAGADGVRLWDAATRKSIGAPLQAHSDQVDAIAFNARGDLLVSAGHDKSVIIWDLASRQVVGEALAGHADYVTDAAFAIDGASLASAGHDAKVILWGLTFERR